jgi:hypothetical protein
MPTACGRAQSNALWTLGTPPTRNPHDGRLNGNILTMLDNQVGTGNPSRAVAYAINEAARTATFLWHHPNAATGGATLGSAQQTDDSVVINWGTGLQPFLEERSFDGQRLMAVGLPNGGNSYRTIKYSPATFDVGRLRSNAGVNTVASPP